MNKIFKGIFAIALTAATINVNAYDRKDADSYIAGYLTDLLNPSLSTEKVEKYWGKQRIFEEALKHDSMFIKMIKALGLQDGDELKTVIENITQNVEVHENAKKTPTFSIKKGSKLSKIEQRDIVSILTKISNKGNKNLDNSLILKTFFNYYERQFPLTFKTLEKIGKINFNEISKKIAENDDNSSDSDDSDSEDEDQISINIAQFDTK